MSLVTPRKTLVQTDGEMLNVQDFSSVGIYLSGTVTITTIRAGAIAPGGTFLHAANLTAPTANTPTIVDVKGVEVIQFDLGADVTGNNGLLVVGQINKVSNE